LERKERKGFKKTKETRTVVERFQIWSRRMVPELESNAVNLRKSLQNILKKNEIET
jgi:hypothetical protein